MYLRHLSAEYRSVLNIRSIYGQHIGRHISRVSADILTDTLPSLGRNINRHQSTHMSADTRPILHRHSAATWLILYRHSTNTMLICSALATEFYLLCSTKRAFRGRRPFLAFNSGNIHVFFPAMFFSFVVTFVYNPRYFRK